jgi:hypothetical protein
LIGNQDGIEQAEERKKIKRKIKMGQLSSPFFLF